MTEQQIPPQSSPLGAGRPMTANGAERLDAPPQTGRRSGWVTFAGVMMSIVGGFAVIEGLIALFAPTYIAVTPNAVLTLDLSGWGWIHLILGVLVLATGLALLGSAPGWARAVAILLVSVNLIVQLAFLPTYPLWSIIVIVIDMVVIYALTVTWVGADA